MISNFIRLIPFLSSLFIFLIFYELIDKPERFYWLSPMLFIIIFFATYFLSQTSLKSTRFWIFLICPLIYLAGILSFIIFLEINWLKIGLAAILNILLGLWLQNLYLYNFKPEKYQTYGLQNFSSYLNLIAVFLITSSFFGFIIFLQLPVWLLIFGVVLITFLTIFQLMRISQINLNKSWLYFFIITMLMIQGFWILAFLPTSIYVNGLVLASVYYLAVGLSLNKLLGILEKSVIKRYVIIVLVVILVTLISAKWV